MDNTTRLLIILILTGIMGFILSGFFGITQLFWFTVIFGIIGFVSSKLFGFSNPAKIATDVIIIVVLTPFFYLTVIASLNPSKAIEILPEVITLWAQNLPGIIIGDVAGTFVATLTGER